MKAIWQPSPLDRGFPQLDLWRAAECNRGYFAARYPTWNGSGFDWHDNTVQLNNAFRSEVTKASVQFGIFRDPHWDDLHDLNQIARIVHEDIHKATGGDSSRQCAYMLDIEFPYRDGAWLLALFKAIRKLRPGRLLSWTMEPLQGGWIKNFPALVDWINHDINFVVAVQTFFGNMDPTGWQAVRDDMKQTKIDPKRIRLFYDGARARETGWDGCIFHAERLVVAARPQLHLLQGGAEGVGPLEAVEEHPLERYRRMRAAA